MLHCKSELQEKPAALLEELALLQSYCMRLHTSVLRNFCSASSPTYALRGHVIKKNRGGGQAKQSTCVHMCVCVQEEQNG